MICSIALEYVFGMGMGFMEVIEAGVFQLMFQCVMVEPLLLDCYR